MRPPTLRTRVWGSSAGKKVRGPLEGGDSALVSHDCEECVMVMFRRRTQARAVRGWTHGWLELFLLIVYYGVKANLTVWYAVKIDSWLFKWRFEFISKLEDIRLRRFIMITKRTKRKTQSITLYFRYKSESPSEKSTLHFNNILLSIYTSRRTFFFSPSHLLRGQFQLAGYYIIYWSINIAQKNKTARHPPTPLIKL